MSDTHEKIEKEDHGHLITPEGRFRVVMGAPIKEQTLRMIATLFVTGLAWCGMMAPPVASAQTVDTWTAIQQLQADLKADRQAVVAANLPLTDGEARAFWPVYKEYRGDVEKVADRVAKLIVAYASNFETMDDTKADAFFKESFAIERDKLAVREKYVSRIRSLLPAQKAARFFQIENKVDVIVNLSLTREIPLIPIK